MTDKQKQYQQIKYSTNIYFNLIQRYQSRINSYFQEQKYTAEDLLGCNQYFFKDYLEFCNDTNKSLFDLEIDHVIPLNLIKDKNNEDEIREFFHYSNCFPVTLEYNKSRKDNLDSELEKKHNKYITAFLDSQFSI